MKNHNQINIILLSFLIEVSIQFYLVECHEGQANKKKIQTANPERSIYPTMVMLMHLFMRIYRHFLYDTYLKTR